MGYDLPGSCVSVAEGSAAAAESFFASLFAAGGLTLSQVVSVTGLEAYTVQNWVARGFLRAPVNKKYTRRQLSRLLIINMLRPVLSLDAVCRLIACINGRLDDEDDDAIDDTRLYMYFLRLLWGGGGDIGAVLSDYREPFPGAAERLEAVLGIMETAYRSACLKREAEGLIAALPRESLAMG